MRTTRTPSIRRAVRRVTIDFALFEFGLYHTYGTVRVANKPTLIAAVVIVDLWAPPDFDTGALEEKQPLTLSILRTSDSGSNGSGGRPGHINSPRCLVGEARFTACLQSWSNVMRNSERWAVQPNTTVDRIRRAFHVWRCNKIYVGRSEEYYASLTKTKGLPSVTYRTDVTWPRIRNVYYY